MKNNKKILVISILIIIVLGILFALVIYSNKNKDNNLKLEQNNEQNQQSSNNTSDDKLAELNLKVDDYYMQNFNQEMFVSQYSYLMKQDGTEVTIEDVAQAMNYEVPEEYSGAVIHFVKPKSLLDYPNVEIKKQEGKIDLEVLTVYTAIPTEDGGMFISSKYDKGGTLTAEEYKDFVLKNSPLYGEVRNPEPSSEEYKVIKSSVGKYDNEVLDGNVKYLACNDKYAMIVISSKDNPANIKQFLLENKDGSWEVIIANLEQKEKSQIVVNVNYPDFDLSMLPKYNLKDFQIVSELDNIIQQLKEQGGINKDEVLTYGCATGKFSYMEFKSGYKILGHINNEGNFDIYEVKNCMSALQKMVELDNINPPTFIINFEN